jgi:LuxR family maltose regulon positive regulatory protein
LLTGRELEVLCLMAAGMKYGEIAAKLVISLNTVRSHVKAIYAKLGVDNRSRAVEAGRRMHLF